MIAVHAAWSAVVRNEGPWVSTERLLLEKRPILEVLPRRAVPAPPTCRPVLAVVRHACRRPMEHIRKSLLARATPLLRAPAFPFERLLDQPVRLRPVAPGAQVEAVETGGHGPSGAGEAMGEADHPGPPLEVA